MRVKTGKPPSGSLRPSRRPASAAGWTRRDSGSVRTIRRPSSRRWPIWVASKYSLASDYVHHEMSTAQVHGKARGLVFLEPMDPTQLPPPFNITMAGRQGAEFFRGSFEDNVAKLAVDIKDLLGRQRRRRLPAKTCAILAAAVVGLAAWAFAALRHAPDSTPPVPIPSKVSGLPAGEVLKVAYTAQPPAGFVPTSRIAYGITRLPCLTWRQRRKSPTTDSRRR